jgi:ketosteroid isomerase-like protein
MLNLLERFTLRTDRHTPTRLTMLACVLAVMVAAPAALSAQADSSTAGPLYDELARMDSLLFNAAFVACDAPQAIAMLADDVEFYHDQTGLESGQQVRETFQRFTQSCPGDRGVIRELVAGSLQVYPIKGYGAIQMGVHRFVERGAPTSTIAKFVHLWHQTEGGWRLARVLSFDHRPAPTK